MRELALRKLGQGLHELSDIDHLTRVAPAFAEISLSLETLGRLPSEVVPRMTCREHAILTAHGMVKSAYAELVQAFYARQRASSGPRPA